MSSTTMFLAHTAAAACQQTEAVSSREFIVGEQRKCLNRKDCDKSQFMKLLYVYKVICNSSIQLLVDIFVSLTISLLLMEQVQVQILNTNTFDIRT